MSIWDYVSNPATCTCENGKYLASIMDDSVIICDEVIESYDEEIKTITTNFDEKNIICRAQNLYILVFVSLIITTLLIAVSIYCYLIKYQAKQKDLLPFHNTKLKQFCVGSINLKWVLKI